MTGKLFEVEDLFSVFPFFTGHSDCIHDNDEQHPVLLTCPGIITRWLEMMVNLRLCLEAHVFLYNSHNYHYYFTPHIPHQTHLNWIILLKTITKRTLISFRKHTLLLIYIYSVLFFLLSLCSNGSCSLFSCTVLFTRVLHGWVIWRVFSLKG